MGERTTRRAGSLVAVPGVALALLLATAACGLSDSAAPRALAGPPGAAAMATDPPIAINEANAAAVAAAPAAVQACVTRNVEVRSYFEKPWYQQGRQRSFSRIMEAVFDRLKIEREGGPRNRVVRKGLLNYTADTRRARVLIQGDPTIVEIREFRRWVKRKAVEASVGRSPRSQVTVTVQRGCFSSKRVLRLRATLDADHRWDARSGTLDADGRQHVMFCGRESVTYAIKLQRRVGPILFIEGGCVRSM